MTSQETATKAQVPATLGQRLREARVARGLTQSELADNRFSKQYVSQLERDQLRPTGETLAWLAERLQIDQSYLATGVDGRQRERVESVVVRAEAAVEAHDYAEAIELLGEIDGPFPGDSAADLELRALLAESWARMYIGEMREALPPGVAEKMSLTSTSFVPSQRPRASVMTPGGSAGPRPPPGGGGGGGVTPA